MCNHILVHMCAHTQFPAADEVLLLRWGLPTQPFLFFGLGSLDALPREWNPFWHHPHFGVE